MTDDALPSAHVFPRRRLAAAPGTILPPSPLPVRAASTSSRQAAGPARLFPGRPQRMRNPVDDTSYAKVGTPVPSVASSTATDSIGYELRYTTALSRSRRHSGNADKVYESASCSNLNPVTRSHPYLASTSRCRSETPYAQLSSKWYEAERLVCMPIPTAHDSCARSNENVSILRSC